MRISIGLVRVDQTNGATLASTIKDCLIRAKLEKCVGQAYEGASNTSGQYHGVARQIQTDNPRHCMFTTWQTHSISVCRIVLVDQSV